MLANGQALPVPSVSAAPYPIATQRYSAPSSTSSSSPQQTDLLKKLLIAEELTAVGVAKSAADLRQQTQLAQAKWRIFTYVFFGVAIYVLTKYFTATITYNQLIKDVDNALRSSKLATLVSGTKVALAFNYPIANALLFGGGQFATAVVWAYYTPAFSSDFIVNMQSNLQKMYDISKNDPKMTANDIICKAFGKQANEPECLNLCKQPATANIVDGIATTFSFAIGLAPFEPPFGLIAGLIGGVGTYLFRTYGQYSQCQATQQYCIRTAQTACRSPFGGGGGQGG